MTGKTLNRPLSKAETQLVERYHNLIYRVMHDFHISEDAASDYYGEAALALVLAAQRYLAREDLQKYRFTTIAYTRIRDSVLRQRRKVSKQPVVLSMDAINEYGGTLHDLIADETAVDPALAAEQEGLLLHFPSLQCRNRILRRPIKKWTVAA